MESCEAVEKEVDKVIKKFTDIKEHSQSTINDIIDTVNLAKSSIDNGKTKNISFAKKKVSKKHTQSPRFNFIVSRVISNKNLFFL